MLDSFISFPEAEIRYRLALFDSRPEIIRKFHNLKKILEAQFERQGIKAFVSDPEILEDFNNEEFLSQLEDYIEGSHSFFDGGILKEGMRGFGGKREIRKFLIGKSTWHQGVCDFSLVVEQAPIVWIGIAVQTEAMAEPLAIGVGYYPEEISLTQKEVMLTAGSARMTAFILAAGKDEFKIEFPKENIWSGAFRYPFQELLRQDIERFWLVKTHLEMIIQLGATCGIVGMAQFNISSDKETALTQAIFMEKALERMPELRKKYELAFMRKILIQKPLDKGLMGRRIKKHQKKYPVGTSSQFTDFNDDYQSWEDSGLTGSINGFNFYDEITVYAVLDSH